MPSIETYRAALRDLPAADWEPYLLAHANLPGPRGNLELAQAVADLGTEAQFRRWAALGPDVAPENTPECFLAFCGVVGLGAMMARGVGRGEVASPGSPSHDAGGETLGGETPPLRMFAPSHPTRAGASARRWRWRCSVGATRTCPALLAEMADWAAGQSVGAARGRRGAVRAAVAEDSRGTRPRSCASWTRSRPVHRRCLGRPQNRGAQDAAPGPGLLLERRRRCTLPDNIGKPLMENWLASPDPDIRWIMRENLKKNRLIKMDAAWVSQLTTTSTN